MTTIFQAITDDFIEELDAIHSLVGSFDVRHPARTRIAAANSATLLVAATFEEFVREMAREYARAVVHGAESFKDLPKDLAATAWKRTMDGIGRIKLRDKKMDRTDEFNGADSRFELIYEFCNGDLSRDIYKELIHNEMNMRPTQLNSLFKLSGLVDACAKCSDKQSMLDVFGQTEPGKAHGKFLIALEDFFERRNEIAHALNPGSSRSPSQISTDIGIFAGFARALTQTLEAAAPQPYSPPSPPLADGQPREEAVIAREAVPGSISRVP